MEKEKLLKALADLRNISFRVWQTYQEEAKKLPIVYKDLRDEKDLQIRALDHMIVRLKNDTV